MAIGKDIADLISAIGKVVTRFEQEGCTEEEYKAFCDSARLIDLEVTLNTPETLSPSSDKIHKLSCCHYRSSLRENHSTW